MSWFISQGNQIGYGSGGGIMNYTLQLRSCGFNVWIIKCFSFKKHFSVLSVFKGTPNYQHILILFTSQPCRYKVIQSNLFLTPLYIHKLQFISDKLRSSSSSHGQLRELVFLFSHWGSHFFWNVTVDYS